jgi:glycosyltransferase involved in cell wall biosynthesis
MTVSAEVNPDSAVRRGRILLAAFDYAPPHYPGTRRARGLAKHLGLLGYDVTVLTSVAGSPTGEPSGGEEVIRTRDLLATSLNWRRQNVEAKQGEIAAQYSSKRSLPGRVLVPDPMVVSWIPFAVPRAIAEHRRNPFDCVLTSSPPESVHLIGRTLARRGVPWVAELRDGWRFERPRRTWSMRAQNSLDAWIERRLLGAAGAISTVTPPVAEDLTARLGLPVVTIGHGFDFETGPGSVEPAASGILDPDRHSLVYTGSITTLGRSLEPLLDALRILARKEPKLLAQLELVIAGPVATEEAEQLEAPWLSGTVRLLGVLGNDACLRLQREADTLLMLFVPGTQGEIGGKLGEYLASGRPILALSERAEGARILERAGVGTLVPGEDPVRIAGALSQLVERGRLPSASGPALESVRREFDFTEVARRVSALVETVRANGTGPAA